MTGLGSRVKSLARRGLGTRAAAAMVATLDAASERLDGRLPILSILTYHRVGPVGERSDLAPTLVTADVDRFRAQMDLVCEVASPVSLDDVLRHVDGGEPLPPRAVLVTFDDAYQDFAEHAWPVLVDCDIRPVMFVPTAFPGDPRRTFWWDDLWAAVWRGTLPPSLARPGDSRPPIDRFRALRDRIATAPPEETEVLVGAIAASVDADDRNGAVMDWDTLGDLATAGLSVAAHTHTHASLHKLTVQQARREIERSIEELLARGFGASSRVLAYPGGGYDAGVRSAAAAAGVTLAVTTDRGVNRLDRLDPLALRRINVGTGTTTAMLRAQLVPSFARLSSWTEHSH